LCTEGTLRWESAGNTVKMYQGGAWDVIYQEDALDRNVTYFGIMRHFLDCIVQDKTPSISLAEGRATLELVLAARKSAESGSVVSL
jgi:predicted dehydrogenase